MNLKLFLKHIEELANKARKQFYNLNEEVNNDK